MSCDLGRNVEGCEPANLQIDREKILDEMKNINSKLDELDNRQNNLLKRIDQFLKPTLEDIYDLPPLQRFKHCTIHNKNTYTILDNMFGGDAKIGSWGGRKIAWTGCETSLRSVAKKVNSIISRTPTFTAQDKAVAKRVTDKINSMWQETEGLIKNRNIFMRFLFRINKLFSWKFTIELPDKAKQTVNHSV